MPHALRTALGITALVLAIGPVALAAQSEQLRVLSDVPPGTRVRLTLGDSLRSAPFAPRVKYLVGQLVRTSGDTLFVIPAGAVTPSAMLFETVRRTERSRGASAVRSALQQGLFAGSMIALFKYTGQQSNGRRTGDVIAWGAAGASFGAIVGAVRPYEQWQRVRLR